MTPAKPLPLLGAVTSTSAPASNLSVVTSWPTVYSLASSVRSSTRYRRGVTPALANTPALGLLTRRGSMSPYPSWTAEYPSVSALRIAVTTHGPAATTVTGTIFPSPPKTWVMPSFVPSTPVTCLVMSVQSLQLDLDIDARGHVKPHQGINCLRRRINDVDQPLVRPHLEMLARVLVLVRRPDNAVHVLLRRQRHGPHDLRTSPHDGIDYLPRRAIDDLMVIALKPNADLLSRQRALAPLWSFLLLL